MNLFWETIIHKAFAFLQPKIIVEIGTSEGRFTQKLLHYCEQHDAILHTIDTADSAWRGPHPRLICHQEISLNALYSISAYDVVLIDGDHNWHTVINELRVIAKYAKNTGTFPAVFLHDIGWPYGRRDLYYNPDTIPDQYKHPYIQGGLIPGDSTICTTGGINHNFFHGIYENNVQSGVLTAIEDFLEETDIPLRFIKIPGMHGLGILMSEQCIATNHQLQEFLESISTSPALLEHIHLIEQERLANVYQLQQEQEQEKQPSNADQQKITELQAAYDSARLQQARLEAESTQLREQSESLEAQTTTLKTLLDHAQKEVITMQSDVAKVRQRSVQEMHALKKEKERLEATIRNHEATQERLEATIRDHEATQERLEADLETVKNTQSILEKNLSHSQDSTKQYFGLYSQMVHSTSWRITHPLRKLGAMGASVRSTSFMYSFFGALHDLWTDFGEPMPKLTRFIRHRLFGKLWPARTAMKELEIENANPVTTTKVQPDTPKDICVVITTSNAANVLAATIDSALRQTHKAKEILVIDDDSTDTTKDIVNMYAAKGVEYLRGQWHNVNAARNAGLFSTQSPFLVFLESGDRLTTDYLEACHATLIRDKNTAIAYTDSICPGGTEEPLTAPDIFDKTRFEHENFFTNGSMVRRSALIKVGGWNHGLRKNAEWITWRRILSEGYNAAKSITSYIHCSSFNTTQASEQFAATLCLSLSGRTWMWPKTKTFLEQQTFPHKSIHLVIADTSQNEAFSAEVAHWAKQTDYAKVTVFPLQVGLKGLAQANRALHKEEVAAACCDIYNAFREYCTAPWALLLEDDVEPPLNAFEQLISHYKENAVSIAALCHKRSDATLPIAWYWDSENTPRDIAHQRGVTSVGGNGFCCTAVRGEHMQNHSFRFGPEDFCHDHNFYADTVRDGKCIALLDWDCVCKHYITEQEWH